LLIALAIAMVARPRWRRLRVPTLMVVSAVAVSWLFELHRYRFV
jgi:hypothetical protein